MDVAVIGGGAAGFFSAIHVKYNHPDASVVIIEKSNKFLSKVKVSGGGRCNVTNVEHRISELVKAYPRGGKQLKKLFPTFSTPDTMKWFEERGVSLVVQDDNCVFPESQNSQSVINCFLSEVNRLGITIQTGIKVKGIEPIEDGKIRLTMDEEVAVFDKIIVATGGSPKRTGLSWLEQVGHEIVEPVPSLFTFNMPEEKVKDLMGVVVEKTITKIPGTKLKSDGPLLITHWGMSGPSILKLSAFGARILSENKYKFKVQVNWVNELNDSVVFDEVQRLVKEYSLKHLSSIRPYYLPERLWRFLLDRVGLNPDKKWNELGKKGINKIVTILTNDLYDVNGKTTFKEEFVTCGGVSWESINTKTMESKVVPNLFFAGEVLDVDGITGGYNFQAAWTTAFVAAKFNVA
ncbi:BaiN/RdsA family NAD(P)/FAD-dependent oxidoreductase [Crocinitomix algicola]|uniref:NAD(P)/FAD-dependent oxidoreductase n=1 Tax=Crocinitomix algicola TaxID=1740263 RepID=UPI00087327E1|nr:NAD(P)/FAD-dependent oxidoreductase [Crocinitomix algicola]